MEPVRSISILREIIRNDYTLCNYGLYRYSTAELRELLSDLTILCDQLFNNRNGCGIVAPVISKAAMDIIIGMRGELRELIELGELTKLRELRELIIEELRERGEVVP